jgi:uncharacterized protein YndB with AHSA1/START domain
MLGGTFTTIIQAPVDRVWSLVGDVGTHASWSPKHYEMVWTGGEANQIGATFHSVGAIPMNSHNENDVEITERAEPTRFAFRSTDPQGVFTNEWNLRPAGEGATEVAWTLTFPKLHGAAAVMAPMLFPLVGKADMRKRLQLLKDKVEAGA